MSEFTNRLYCVEDAKKEPDDLLPTQSTGKNDTMSGDDVIADLPDDEAVKKVAQEIIVRKPFTYTFLDYIKSLCCCAKYRLKNKLRDQK